jgi:hypothetical protein
MLASDDEPLVFSAISGQPDWVSRAADGSSIGVVPPSGVTGTFAFLATVSDPGGLTATATITLTLNNQPPTALDDVYRTTESLLFLDPSPVANDSDPEGQPLTIRSVTSRDANRGVVQSQNGNTVMVSVAHGVSVFDYTITDPGGQSASAVITVISNHAPTMPDASGETNQSSLSVTLSPTDADAEDLGHLDTACMPPNGWDYQLLHDPATGPPAVPDRMRAYFTVAPGTAPGVYAFPCTTTDPLGASGSATITITIDP